MKKADKSENLKNYVAEGDERHTKDNIGNAALLLAMLMITGAIFFLIAAFADH